MHDEIVEAIKQGDVSRVRSLSHEDKTVIHAGSMSLVLLSVYMKQPDITQALLETGVNLTLHTATACGDAMRVSTIVREQPDRVNKHRSDSFHPLGLATYFGHVDVVDALLDVGANVNLHSSNTQHVTALHSAVSARHDDIIDRLLQWGADANAAEQGGITRLMQAAHQDDIDLVRKLLRYGADAAMTSTDGKRVLDYTSDIHATGVMTLLEQTLP
ncbi:MAG: ankyrin repeat domain-containing protein [Chloroflexota bacterium]